MLLNIQKEQEELPKWVIMEVDGPITWDAVPVTCSKPTNEDADCVVFPEETRVERPDPDYDSINVSSLIMKRNEITFLS